MLQAFKILTRTAALLIFTFALAGCPQKKVVEDSSAAGGGEQAPSIDSSTMSFDASGSDSGRIEGLVSINFDYDRSSLSADAKKKIQGNVEWMKAHPNATLQVEGHCDSHGSIEYNLALGERRARAVKAYMTSLGASDSKVNVISYGKEKPLAQGDSEEVNAKNRRANFVPLAQ
jgi:peptidoglycan-associated lipoprotein